MAVSATLVVGFTLTLRCAIDTEIGRVGTVIVAVARRVVSTVDSTVIVELPTVTAVTRPVALTVATAGLLDRQVTVWASPASALTVAVSCWVAAMNTEAVAGVTATDRTTGTMFTTAVPRSVVSAVETA